MLTAFFWSAVRPVSTAPPEPSRIWALVSLVTGTPTFCSFVTICGPVASETMPARVRLRKARLRSGALKPSDSLPPNVLAGRCLSGSTMRVSMRIALLTLLAGASSGCPPAAKSYIRRQSASQLLARMTSPPSVPPRPEKSNM